MKTFKFIFVLLLLIPIMPAYSQQNASDPFSIMRQALNENINYLKAINNLQAIKPVDDSVSNLWHSYMQAALTCNTFLLNNPNIEQLVKEFYTNVPEPSVSYKIVAENDEAIKKIIKDTENRQVVMINESHWHSKHRYFVNTLLKPLYNNGFRYLAVEALWENADTLNLRGYAISSTGLYTVDPRMANLLRDAIQLGFKVIAYDDFTKNREFNQAANIIEQTLKNEPNTKILVYAGGDHINKSDRQKKMAYYFQQISGIHPFVIRQTADAFVYHKNYNGIAIIGQTDTLQENILIANGITESDFLCKPDFPQKNIAFAEMSDFDFNATNQYHSLSIYIENEFNYTTLKTVPIASYLLAKNNIPDSIKLPAGKYTVVIRNIDGEVIHQNPYKVEIQ